ncbi:MAG: glycosyltransferase [Cyclobacteriaceae bacterium]|jgi:glycosyltransferase involved in cell wall biosynthesis
MKKRTILIASVLKPVDDTRAFGKIGITLAKAGYDVHLVGRSAGCPAPSEITFHELGAFDRLSWRRVFAPLNVMVKIIKVKPEVLIVTTHELLIVALLNRIIFGGRFVYDIQENYGANIRLGGAFAGPLRQVLAAWVRLWERLAVRVASSVWLAEKCYLTELDFLPAGRVSVVENKAQRPEHPPVRKPLTPSRLSLLFTGTLAGSTGLWNAIDLARLLHPVLPGVTLHLAGYCALDSDRQRLKVELAKQDFVALEGGDTLVPHNRIIELIRQKDVGLIVNPVTAVNEHRIPTKIYEYLAHRLPVIVTRHQPWLELVQAFNAGTSVDLRYPDPEKIVEALSQQPLYTREPEGIFWEEEETKVLQTLNRIR